MGLPQRYELNPSPMFGLREPYNWRRDEVRITEFWFNQRLFGGPPFYEFVSDFAIKPEDLMPDDEA